MLSQISRGYQLVRTRNLRGGVLLVALALATACTARPVLVGHSPGEDADPDPYVSLCEGMLQHVVRERPLPSIHLLWGWSAAVISSEHTGGELGTRHHVSLVYDATTSPGTEEMPVRDRMTCEYPSDPLWWSLGKSLPNGLECKVEATHLLPDRIIADGKETRYDDRGQGRAKIKAWADDVKEGLCARGRGSLWPRTPAGLPRPAAR